VGATSQLPQSLPVIPEARPWLRHYEPGVPWTIEIPETTLPEYLALNAGRYPRREAIRFFGKAIHYRELDEAVNRFANALIRLGVEPGDRVGLVLPNCPQIVIGYYGALRAGAVVVPCNPLYAEPELAHQLADAGVKVVLCLSLMFPKVQAVRDRVPTLEHVVVTNIKEYLPPLARVGFTLFRERKEGHEVTLPEDGRTHWLQPLLQQAPATMPSVRRDPDDLAVLQYTAGTTGVPKGAMLTHRNLVAVTLQTHAWARNIEEPDGSDVVLGVIPIFHIYGQTVVMNFPIVSGGCMILIPRFDLKAILEAIDHEHPTFFPGVPTMYAVLANAPKVEQYNLRSLKACISGAAPLPVPVQEQFERLTGARLVEGYGLSEAPVTHCNPILGERRAGTIGLPIPSTEAIVVDLETGTTMLPPGEVGELAVRGPQVMQGYWQRPDETERVFRGSWFLTGDIARMTEDGYFQIVDRRKDMIIVGGLKVFPSEVEKVLLEHPAVQEAVVVGIPDPYRGEMVKAYVVLREGASVEPRELLAFCRERLAPHRVPREIEIRTELPKNLIGKVLRRKLIEEELAKRHASAPEMAPEV